MGLMRTPPEILLVVLVGVIVSGCGIHLYRPADAKQAHTAGEAYDKVAFDTIVTTARSNASALDKAEQDSVLALSDLVARRDLVAVVTQASKQDNIVPLGWAKLVKEVLDELVPLGLLKPPGVTLTNDEPMKKLRYQRDRQQFASTNRARFDLFVKDYKRSLIGGTLPMRCDYPRPTDDKDQVRKPQQLPPQRPAEESERAWRIYRNQIVPACAELLEDEDKANIHGIMLKDAEYADLTQQIAQLESRLGDGAGEAKRLSGAYTDAKAKVEKAQADLANRTVEKEKDKAATQLAEAQKKVADAATGLEAIVKAANQLPLAVKEASKLPWLEAQLKSDLLAEILSNFQAVGGKRDAATHEVMKQFIAVLKQSPDVAARFGASETPSINVLVMELAIQRLAAQRLTVERDKMADERALLRARRELRVDSVRAWIVLAEDIAKLTNPPSSGTRLATYVSANPTERAKVERILSSYAYARLKYDLPDAKLALQVQQRERSYATDTTEVALTAWKDFIRAPLQEITAYHEGGLRPEDIANLIHAVGLGGIAVGVNR